LIAACAALGACATPFGLGGQELDDNANEAGVVDTNDTTDTTHGADFDTPDGIGTMPLDLAIVGLECGDAGPPSLAATPDDGGGLRVVQSGIRGPSSAEWQLSAQASTDVVLVSYQDVSGASDAPCPWRFEYVLPDVPSGSWTVTASPLPVQAVVLP